MNDPTESLLIEQIAASRAETARLEAALHNLRAYARAEKIREHALTSLAVWKQRHPDAIDCGNERWWSPGAVEGRRIDFTGCVAWHPATNDIPPCEVCPAHGRLTHRWSGGRYTDCGRAIDPQPPTTGKRCGRCFKGAP